jgi:hypothetical protein
MDRREAVNSIIMNIAGRDRHDMVLYPAMIAIVMLSYLSILSYYVVSLFSEYRGDVPAEQMFGTLALLLMGVSLILAIFYLLMTRNSTHSKRESSLRKAMTAYAEAGGAACGIDIAPNIEKLRRTDARFDAEERMGSPMRLILWIALPAMIGFLLMWLPGLKDNAPVVVVLALGVSLVLAAVISPQMTSFAAAHDKRTREFTAAFCDACRPLGLKLVPTSKAIGYRSFKVFAVLTAVTVGFFSIYWVYLVFNDMNKHFMEQWRFEDGLLRTVRSSEICAAETREEAEAAADDPLQELQE